jgi:hypothetical protein
LFAIDSKVEWNLCQSFFELDEVLSLHGQVSAGLYSYRTKNVDRPPNSGIAGCFYGRGAFGQETERVPAIVVNTRESVCAC